MESIVVIPARYESSRFPGKPLVPLLGKPMVLWVAEISATAVGKEAVYVATDDEIIAGVVESAGFKVIMTSSDALTGTDRVAEVARVVEADVYINVQGDEPLLNPMNILAIKDKKIAVPDSVINGYCNLSEDEDPANVNIPKVVIGEDNRLTYISRSVVPGSKTGMSLPEFYKKQVGIYAFSSYELNLFADLGRKSSLEMAEDIEILRFLDLGYPVTMVNTTGSSLAVDVPGDVDRVEAAMRELSE